MSKKVTETRRDFIKKATVAVPAIAAVVGKPKQKKVNAAASCSCAGKGKKNGVCTGKGSKAASCSCGGTCSTKKKRA
ncbi:MAG: twin-arginine translocation signal domain-containing protein [Planctomycetaceae bacterium]|nr:twin-arginine translocation signal domain-containing protein [Planctomycetaceae bacterium]